MGVDLAVVLEGVASLIGIAGLFVAIRAYQVAKKQTAKLWQLEILRELGQVLDDIYNSEPLSFGGTPVSYPNFTSNQISSTITRLELLHADSELPTWRQVIRAGGFSDDIDAELPAMHTELLKAIKGRMT